MTLEILDGMFSVCRIADETKADWGDSFCFLAQTDEERSLVCRTSRVPDGVIAREDGWQAMRVKGTLDFSLIGILSRIASVLAENGISIFAVSTYNTDYILTRSMDAAAEALEKAGYRIVRASDHSN